ncbi:hypothetical protein MauCBS54593_004085 [Microsporum audouinii]
MTNSTTKEPAGGVCMEDSPCGFGSLPSEILCLIGGYLDAWDLRALVMTATRFHMALDRMLMRKALRDVTVGDWADFHTILRCAISKGHIERAKALLEIGRGSLVMMTYRSALECAAEKGYLDLVQIILNDSELDLSKYGTQALNKAIVSQSPEIYTLLAGAGAMLKDRVWHIPQPNLGIYAVHAAACWGRIDLLQFIMSCGADLDEPEPSTSWRPLHYAAFHGQALFVEFLLDNGVNPIARCVENNTAMMNIAITVEPPYSLVNPEFKKRTMAFSAGHRRVIEMLLDHGSDLSMQNHHGITVLHLASANGYVELVKYLISLGADTTSRDTQGLTPLYHAISNCQVEVVKVLLAAGASLTTKNNEGACAIHIAAEAGYPSIELLQLLTMEDVDPLAIDYNRRTALHYAAEGGSMDTLQLLLKKTGAKLTPPPKKPLALNGAVEKHDPDMVRYLLEAGADISCVRGNYMISALHIAIAEGAEDLVELLLKYGADPNRYCCSKRYPLQCAIKQGATAIARVLLRNGADISAKGNPSEPPLILAARGYGSGFCDLSLVKMLIEEGAEINICRHESYGVLEAVASHPTTPRGKSALIISYFLENGVDISRPSNDGGSILSPFCKQGGHDNSIKMLIEAGADIKCQDRSGNTLLHDLAFRCGTQKAFSINLFQEFMDRGADASLVNRVHQTPLHVACSGGLDFNLQPLFDAGMDPLREDICGWTAIHYAAWAGHPLQLSQLIRALKRRAISEDTTPMQSTKSHSVSPEAYIKSILDLKDVYGWTALHLSVMEFAPAVRFRNIEEYCHPNSNESHEVVQLLLESGVDPSLINSQGQTPLDLARTRRPSCWPFERTELNRRKSFMLLSGEGLK